MQQFRRNGTERSTVDTMSVLITNKEYLCMHECKSNFGKTHIIS